LTRDPDSNLTLPSIRLNNVKSRPRPTFWFSTQRAPRWRMMMPPARMDWPSLTLMPSRLEWESRPFLDEPPPFLCAIGRRIIGTDPVEVKSRRSWNLPNPRARHGSAPLRLNVLGAERLPEGSEAPWRLLPRASPTTCP